MAQIDLAGQVAVVTGGAQGIGLAVARELAACGAAVSLWDIDGSLAEAAASSLDAEAMGFWQREYEPGWEPTV